MFTKAKPIFLKDLALLMNISAVFICELPKVEQTAVLRVTGATRYRVYFNKKMLHFGPARAAHGFFRVDELPLDLKEGGTLRIDVVSSNVRGYDGVNHPGFLQAEVRVGDAVIAATGYDFLAFRNTSRVQKTMRFACSRQFSEVYRGFDQLQPCPWEVRAQDYVCIPRQAPMPCMDMVWAKQIAARGTFIEGPHTISRHTFVEKVPEIAMGYTRGELEAAPYDTLAALVYTPTEVQTRQIVPETVREKEYVLYDFGRVYTGFMTMQIEVLEDAELSVSYESVCDHPYVTGERIPNSHLNLVNWTLPKGVYPLENFDPFDMRYLQFNVLSGCIRIDNVGMRQFIYPAVPYASIETGDAVLDKIYDAAVATFRQSSVDIFMDCPTRERAGWLCDSYYTANAEYTLTGDNRLERVFLKNFVDCGQRPELPEGMIPKNYPGEVINGGFIPQWPMWYILELEEALGRSKEMDKEVYRKVCYGLLGFYARYLNEDGLLESMPGWNFVEWSRCNNWVDGVSYPTNFLYCRVLKAVGTIYDDQALLKQSQQVRDATIDHSFDGTFFIENALRDENGVLKNTSNTSETCQYYAIHFGELDLTESRFAGLQNIFMNVFGPDREKYAALNRDVEPSAPFVGIYLRMECLLDYGMKEKLLNEIKGFFGRMADLTGTLWETAEGTSGVNHGFASYVATVIAQCMK